jgi:hypothetical protein
MPNKNSMDDFYLDFWRKKNSEGKKNSAVLNKISKKKKKIRDCFSSDRLIQNRQIKRFNQKFYLNKQKKKKKWQKIFFLKAQ